MKRALPEYEELERIIERAGARFETRVACEVEDRGRRFAVYSIALGNRSLLAPAVGFFAGVHGLERVGTHVLLSFLDSLVARLESDARLARLAADVRLVFMPLVNPAGMSRDTRANANDVDLMRNAPFESAERVAFLLGGQRVSRALPWYRGRAGEPMEPEAQALCELVRAELLARPFSIALDCHSGFGVRDRIWFPYAHTRRPFARLAEVYALATRFDEAHPAHPYLFEPQSRRYLAHGDLWDYLCSDPRTETSVFLPLTLEMGSWRWVRKRPRQILSRLGIFNPLPPDRLQRVRRNHLAWLYFLCEAARSHREWLPVGEARASPERAGLAHWFA